MNPVALHLVPLGAMLIVAAGFDIYSRRLPNAVTLSVLITGLLQSMVPGHFVTPVWAILGMLVGLALPLPMFALGAIGGGDVKLLAGIGAWLGPLPALLVFMIEAVIGMVIVLIQAVATGRTSTLLRNSAMLAMNIGHVKNLGVEHVKETGQSCRSVQRPLPYAVPVLISTALVIWTMLHHGG